MLSTFIWLAVSSMVTGEFLGNSEIAFSAGITNNVALSHHERVPFDSVFTNIGAAYDTTTGTFNCPMSGIYLFQVHTLSNQDKTSWLELYHNTYYIFSIYGHKGNNYGAGGNSVILKLSKGDQVFVRAVDSKYGASTNIYGKPDEIYSTFSGYLLAPVYEDIPSVG